MQPSDLEFGAYLIYPTGPRDQLSQRAVYARNLVLQVKQDRTVPIVENDEIVQANAVELAVTLLSQSRDTVPFADRLSEDAVLVPLPKSAPLKEPTSVWPAHRICEEMIRRGLGGDIAPCLSRRTAVRKSATAPLGERPTWEEHFESIEYEPTLGLSERPIVLVDDVVTKGSTMLGCAARLEANALGTNLFGFGIASSRSVTDMPRFGCPVAGTITLGRYGAWRRFEEWG